VIALATLSATISVGAAALIRETHSPTPAPPRVGSRLAPGNLIVRSAVLPGFLQFFVSGCSASILAFVPLHAAGVGMESTGPFFTLYASSVLLSRLGAGRIADRLGRQAAAVPAVVVVIVGMALLAFAAN